ncbi:MAG: rRNA maturation RNase YbeY [Muribaculaceae bacterium]|nr:rRNA maturation RNase YbeY [Muribaculaceae bacterium]
MITYNAENIPMPKIRRRDTSAWIKRVAAGYGRTVGEVGYLFCDDEKILEVNREYLGHDYYTDIITFDYTNSRHIAGDMVISLDTVRSNAEMLGVPYETELMRVMIHGVLHLCGQNDKGPGEREVMERYENEALALLPDNVIEK